MTTEILQSHHVGHSEAMFPKLPPLEDDQVKITIHFTKIEAVREADSQFNDVRFPIDMNIGEAVRRLDNTAIINFSIIVATDPKIAFFEVKCEAMIKGSPEKLHALTIPGENSQPPAIWKDIYREAMTIVSILTRVFSIPSPPPI